MAIASCALCVAGCAGSGSTAFGPTQASSVSPVGTAPTSSASPSMANAAAKPAQTRSLAAVQSWTLTPTLPDSPPSALLAALTTAPEQLLIVDPAALAAASQPNAKAPSAQAPAKPLAALQQNGHRRILALFNVSSISEKIATWQTAWEDPKTGALTSAAPSWLEAADAKTPGVHPVRFWDGGWQKRLTASLDPLLKDGYDGVCLQGVGAFRPALADHPSAANDMAALVGTLAAHARKSHPNFSVVVEGATDLPASLTKAQSKDYLSVLDGVLARDVFYPGDKPADNALAPAGGVLAALDTFQKAGKTIFITERLTDPAKIKDFVARAKSKGYVPDAALAGAAAPASPIPSASPARLAVYENKSMRS